MTKRGFSGEYRKAAAALAKGQEPTVGRAKTPWDRRQATATSNTPLASYPGVPQLSRGRKGDRYRKRGRFPRPTTTAKRKR